MDRARTGRRDEFAVRTIHQHTMISMPCLTMDVQLTVVQWISNPRNVELFQRTDISPHPKTRKASVLACRAACRGL